MKKQTVLLHCPEPGVFLDSGGRPVDVSRYCGRQATGAASQILLVVPGELTLFTAIEVSRAERRHLQRILPWRFEETLADPVEKLHFAHRLTQQGRADVCAIDAAWLEAVLAAAREAGLEITADAGGVAGVISELALVPWQTESWSLQIPAGSQKILLRHGPHHGLVCSPDNLSLVLAALLDEEQTLPRRIGLYCSAEQAATIKQGVPPTLQSLLSREADPAPALAQEYCNLLQGAFAPPLPWRRWWRQWRVAAVLLLGILISDLAFTFHGIRQLERETEELLAAARAEVQQVLPDGVVVDPLLQLRRAVAAGGGADSLGFLALLSRMSPVLADSGSLAIESLEYSQNNAEINLVVRSPDFTTVENFRSGLQAAGLSAELVGSSNDGQRSLSRLRIRG